MRRAIRQASNWMSQTARASAHLHQAEQRALDLKDQDQQRIAEFLKDKDDEQEPKVKPPAVIKASALANKDYLESEEDIEKFLNDLRSKLEEAIANGQRIEIR